MHVPCGAYDMCTAKLLRMTLTSNITHPGLKTLFKYYYYLDYPPPPLQYWRLLLVLDPITESFYAACCLCMQNEVNHQCMESIVVIKNKLKLKTQTGQETVSGSSPLTKQNPWPSPLTD